MKKDDKKGLALPEVSVPTFTEGNSNYPLKVEPAKYPKHMKYDAPINLQEDGQFQHQLTTEVPRGKRIERNFSKDEIYSDLHQGDIKPPGKSGFDVPKGPNAPSLPGGSKN